MTFVPDELEIKVKHLPNGLYHIEYTETFYGDVDDQIKKGLAELKRKGQADGITSPAHGVVRTVRPADGRSMLCSLTAELVAQRLADKGDPKAELLTMTLTGDGTFERAPPTQRLKVELSDQPPAKPSREWSI